MALLLQRTSKRLDVPHEPGEWIEIRRLAACELPAYERIADAGTRGQATLDLFNGAIVAWSYDAPVSPETVRMLDAPTALWLLQEINRINWSREGDAELFPSSSPSSAL